VVIQGLSGSWCIKGTGASTLVMDSPVPLMHHDPDRSWITDPDLDHPKGLHPKTNHNMTQTIKETSICLNAPKTRFPLDISGFVKVSGFISFKLFGLVGAYTERIFGFLTVYTRPLLREHPSMVEWLTSSLLPRQRKTNCLRKEG